MEQSTLKYLRIVVPGLIFLIDFFPIYQQYFSGVYKVTTIDFSYLILLSLVSGSIYYQMNIQHLITRPSHYIITNNIKKHLIKISGLTLTKAQQIKISKKRKYMHVFYNLIDKDESLKRKTANVYFNGVFWTSTADSSIINFVFYFLYRCPFSNIPKAADYAKMCLILAGSSLLLHIISVIKHIVLSNEQLDYMSIHNREEVKKQINGILQ